MKEKRNQLKTKLRLFFALRSERLRGWWRRHSTRMELHWARISKKNAPFATVSLVLYSFAIGIFLTYHNDFLITRTEPYLQQLPISWMGVLLMLGAILEGVAVWKDWDKTKYGGVILLSICWGALTFLSLTYHVGTGYPDISYIHHFYAVAQCMYVANQGRYALE